MNFSNSRVCQNTSHTFSVFVNQLDKLRFVGLEEDVTAIIEEIKILEKFSYIKNRYYFLFSLIDFSPVYVSANIVQHSYTQEEFINLTPCNLFKMFCRKELSSGIKMVQWFHKFRKIVPDFGRNDDEVIFFGVKIKGKKGEIKTFLLKGRWISLVNQSNCSYIFFEAEEIGDIYKADFWWGKYKTTRRHYNISRYYFTDGSKKESADLFSQRGWEVLKFLMKQKDSAEIGRLLNISVETVKKHRKNIIARTGVKDTTALIQLLKLGGIVN